MDERAARTLLERERARLEDIRRGLLAERTEGSPGAGSGELSSADQHPADLGSETFERAKNLSILSNVDAQLEDVDRAVERLEDGTYGTCEACGRRIEQARLEAKPAARFCVDDQARAEREALAG